MLLSGALFALFITGFWLYCLTDAILTPRSEYRGLSKPAWIAIIAVTFIAGGVAWLVVRHTARRSARPLGPMPRWDRGDRDDDGWFLSLRWTDGDDALARHPAGRAREADAWAMPRGPDDDLEFLSMLDRAIRDSGGNSQPDEA
jgi:hypothetical protein